MNVRQAAASVVKMRDLGGRTEPVTTAATSPEPASASRAQASVLRRLLSGSFWLAIRTPIQAVFSLWTVPLIMEAVNAKGFGAYGFAYGFGFLQLVLEFGMSSALQRHISETWTKGDREGVDRAIACGMNFYGVMAAVQAAALLAIGYFALPLVDLGGPQFTALAFKLICLQAVTAPCFGMSAIASSVLQAAHRYDFVPRLELGVVLARFLVLLIGVKAGFDFFSVVATQTAVQIAFTLLPALVVMTRELGYRPHFGGTRLSDYKPLLYVSTYMFLMQISVVLADKIDTTVLGFALPDAGSAIAVYQVVSKPFLQIRQTGWTLAYLVLPAVASLAATRDQRGMDRVKYDGTRLHIGLILPSVLLAWVYAAPFLTLWVGNDLGYDAARLTPLLRLFLLATLPLVLSVPVQAAFGINKVEVVAIAAFAGSIVNLPVSIMLTKWLGVSGVIWGTLLTTFFSNLLVPGFHVFRVLEIRPRTFFSRTLSAPLAGALGLMVMAALLGLLAPLHPSPSKSMSPLRWVPLAWQLMVCGLAYVAGYISVPIGMSDFRAIAGKFVKRAG